MNRSDKSDVREVVIERSKGVCEVCGGSLTKWDGMSVHHRKPRKMGGSKDPALWLPSNLLVVCGSGTSGCHGDIEHKRGYAKLNGWLLKSYEDPAVTPVRLFIGWRMLNEDGTISPLD